MLRSLYQALLIATSFCILVQTSSPSVVIIGAGASGIAAATKLVENGITNITILEAENRIGGRIDSAMFGGVIVDMGAEYCDGQEGNVIYDLAKNFDVLGPTSPLLVNIYYSNGSLIDPSLAQELNNFYASYRSVNDGYNTTGVSVGDLFQHRFYSTFLKQYETDNEKVKVLKDTLRLLDGFTASARSSSWFDMSADSDFEPCEGAPLLWKGVGFKTILDIMSKSFPDPAQKLPLENKIILRKKVTKVIWNKTNTVTVLTSDQSSYSADHVIFTPSLGVLKAEKGNMFDPQLPPLKQNAIETIGYAGVIKFYMFFPDKWWNEDDKIFTFLFRAEDLYSVNFTEGPRSNGRPWVTNFVFMTQPYGHSNVWGGWIYGDVVAEVEKLPLETFKRGIKYVLDKFLGKKYHVTDIGEIILSKWCLNENFYGTYTFTKTGTYSKNLSYQKVLGEPLTQADGTPIVLFAGEATNPQHYGTVHGAIESGYREADRIINLSKTVRV